jgi:hypothetical protein
MLKISGHADGKEFMLMWIKIDNPSQDLLDKLLADAVINSSACPDCGVKIGDRHLNMCDVERCLRCGSQRISCNCDDSVGHGIWTGIWPGCIEAYYLKLVCKWGDNGDPQFDLNEVGMRRRNPEGDSSWNQN